MSTSTKELGAQRIRAEPATIDSDGQGVLVFDFAGYMTGRRGIATRLIAGIAPGGPASQVLADSFTRVVAANSWGSPDIGPAYTIPAGTLFSVNGTRGLKGTAAEGQAMAVAAVGAENGNAVATLSNMNLTLSRVYGINARQVGTVGVQCWVGNAAPPNLGIALCAGDIGVTDTVQLVASSKVFATLLIRMRLDWNDLTLRAKFWDSIDPEPNDFDLAVTSPSIPAPVPGGVGIFGNSGPGTNLRFDADDFEVFSVPAAPLAPTWEAYIGDPNDPTNLVDSSQGIALPRWVPALVNGQPIFQGDVLRIVATGGSPGETLVASCYLITEPV